MHNASVTSVGACGSMRGGEDEDRIPLFSELLRDFRATLPTDRVSLEQALEALGPRSYGGFLLVLAIPTVMPVPLGVTIICNLPILIFSAQMMVGRRSLVLPAWLLNHSLPTSAAEAALNRLIPYLAAIEPLLKPRMLSITAPQAVRWLGIACFFMAIIAVVPLPLVGWLPGFGLFLVALGLLARDGVVVALGLALGVAAVAFAAVVVAGLAYAGTAILEADLAGPMMP